MQTELLNGKSWRTLFGLANAIVEYLDVFHNRRLRHSVLGIRGPVGCEKVNGETITLGILSIQLLETQAASKLLA